MKTIGLLILLTLVPLTSLHAQNREIKFEHFGTAQGLSQNTVYCILQDHQGFLWFGTQTGLNKYDGYNFTVYQHDVFDSTSLRNNVVAAIWEDHTGTLWAGTANGLSKFDREKEQFCHFVHNSKNPRSLSNNGVTTLHEDRSGTLWVGTDDGLNKLDREKKQFTRFVHNPQNSHSLSDDGIMSIYEDRAGTLWVGTWGGLNKFDREKGQFIRFIHNPNNPHSLSNNIICTIYEDRSGTFWVGTLGGGLNMFDREKERFTHFSYASINPRSLSQDSVKVLYEDRAGTLWVGTGSGLNIFDREKAQFTRLLHDVNNPHSLSDNLVLSICEDRSGIIWIGAFFRGLNKFDRGKEPFISMVHDPKNPNSLNAGPINSIYQDRAGALWIGTHIGANRFNRKTRQFTNFVHDPNNSNSVSHNFVSQVYEDRLGTLWMGTWGCGLNRFDRDKEQFTRFTHDPKNPHSISFDIIVPIRDDAVSPNILWIGTIGGGLNRFDRNTGQFTHYIHDPQNPHSLSDNGVWWIEVDSSNGGILWIGTGNGLNRFDPNTERFTRFLHDSKNPQSLNEKTIWSLYLDRTGTLWIATNGGGLDKLVRHKNRTNHLDSLLIESMTESWQFSHYTVKDGLADNVINSILGDGRGRLWMSTNKGISCFDRRTNTFRNYDVTDGLVSNEYMSGVGHKIASGEIFFGSFQSGISAFHPDSIEDNPYMPPVVITAFKRYNTDEAKGIGIVEQGISVKKAITVSYKDNLLNFEFAALSYRNTFKNKYAYKLEGYSDQWIQLGTERRVSFTNLDPGEYNFRVKGSNNDGVWNEDGTSLKITVTPPWWKTKGAYASYVLLFTFLLYGWRRYDSNRVKLRNELRMKNFEAQKLQEVDHMKSRFFANISHEFRTPLTLILGQLDSAIPTIVQEKTKSKMQMAFRNARQLLRLINQLLDLSKIEAGSMALKTRRTNLIPFLKNLVFSFESLAVQKGITLQFHTTHEDLEIYFEPEKLEKVFYNLLANAFKFTAENGKITVVVARYTPLNPPSRAFRGRFFDLVCSLSFAPWPELK